MKGKLYFLVGLPRAGKSTRADYWQQCCVKVTYDPKGNASCLPINKRVVLNGDDFRWSVYGRDFCPEGEGLVFSSIDTAARALLRAGYDVLIDETSTTESTIRRYLKIDPDAEAIFVDTPEEECIRRALKDGKTYLVEPIKRMSEQLKILKYHWPHNFKMWREYAIARISQDTDTKNV